MNNTSCEAEIPLSVVEELGTDKSTSKGCACRGDRGYVGHGAKMYRAIFICTICQ
jgi:hypothetical protein